MLGFFILGGSWPTPRLGVAPGARVEQYVSAIPTTTSNSKSFRLVNHGTRAVDGGPFTLHSIELTLTCRRGVDADGLCV